MGTKDDESRTQPETTDPVGPAGPHPVPEPCSDPLTVCEEKVQELKEENAELRESAESFGELAERLNREKRSDS